MSATSPEPRVTLITRVNCHLCDVAKQALVRVAAATGVTWREVDVDADPALLDEYSDLVPVILVDGKTHGYWRVEEDRLLRDLATPPAR
jgi:glutaredoxin